MGLHVGDVTCGKERWRKPHLGGEWVGLVGGLVVVVQVRWTMVVREVVMNVVMMMFVFVLALALVSVLMLYHAFARDA